jgi:hypothetical protein
VRNKDFFIAWGIWENFLDKNGGSYLRYNEMFRQLIPLHKLNPYY